MPVRINVPTDSPVAEAAPRQGGRVNLPADVDVQEESGWGGKALAVGAAGLTALMAASPKARGVAKAGLSAANQLRQQLMLSGYALPKSVLGGVGAVGEMALETGSLKPVKELLKMQTVKDVASAYQNHSSIGPTPGILSKIPNPGRVMGAFDTGFQEVLKRAGMTAQEAQAAMLQAPLEGRMGQNLESATAAAIHPFRRTPVNSFLEGFGKIKNAGQNPGTMAAYAGTGAVHGAATADEDYPVSVPMAIAASARYGLPYGLAALVARGAMGATDGGGIASSMVPFSEYGTEQATSLAGLTRPFYRPGIAKVISDFSE